MLKEAVEKIPTFITLFIIDFMRIIHLVLDFKSNTLKLLAKCLHLFVKSIKLYLLSNFNLLNIHFIIIFFLEAIEFNFKTYY